MLAGSPAEAAGVLRGDVILEIDGKPVREVSEITQTIAAAAPGTQIQLKLLRAGMSLTVTTNLGDRSALEWNRREDEMNQLRQKEIRRSIEQLQLRLQQLQQQRVPVQ